MTADQTDRSADADASADMESKLAQLDEHIDEAVKMSQDRRPEGDPPEGDVLDDVAGGGSDHEERVDDPETSPIIDTE